MFTDIFWIFKFFFCLFQYEELPTTQNIVIENATPTPTPPYKRRRKENPDVTSHFEILCGAAEEQYDQLEIGPYQQILQILGTSRALEEGFFQFLHKKLTFLRF